MQSFPLPMNVMEEKDCIEQLKAGKVNAKEQLIIHNLRLVAHIAKKYYAPGRDLEELLSVGELGLVKAVNTFEADKGHKITTYAARCIENEILMLLRAKKRQMKDVSLFEPVGSDQDGNEICLLDVIESEEKEYIEIIMLDEMIKKLYYLVERVLTQREYKIICMRYGLYTSQPLPQREIAKILNISRSYVSRIEKKALEKLRVAFNDFYSLTDDKTYIS